MLALAILASDDVGIKLAIDEEPELNFKFPQVLNVLTESKTSFSQITVTEVTLHVSAVL